MCEEGVATVMEYAACNDYDNVKFVLNEFNTCDGKGV